MNAAGLAKILENPELLRKERRESLAVWLEDYPYCQALQFALLKKMQMEGEELDEFLPRVALAAPDRMSLYQFIVLDRTIDRQGALHLWDAKSLPPARISSQAPMLEFSETNSIIVYSEPMTFHTARNADSLDGDTAHAGRKGKKRFRLPRIPTLENSEVLDVFEQHPKASRQTTKEEQAKEPKRSPFNFTADTEAFLFSLTQKAKNRDLASGKQSPVSKEQTDELVKRSVEENEEVISETLAKLLALQGQKEKAIKMYGALSLKFPEKSRFFAERIKELQSAEPPKKA